MNNDQFRRLILSAGGPAGSKKEGGKAAATPGGNALGSRQRASIPMTPRSGGNVSRVAFARQMAERFQDAEAPKKAKRFRTAAPKGSRLAAGYIDRAKERPDDAPTDDREQQLAALEEARKTEQIDQATYEKRQLEIAGGDLSSTHLVKGLDYKLLERVRRGEDVFEIKAEAEGPKSGDDDENDNEDEDEDDSGKPAAATEADDGIDDELLRIEEGQVATVAHEKTKKRGQFAPAALVPGQKRTRDQILAAMKAARAAAKAQAPPTLGARFKKISAPQKAGSRIEVDSQGREVLVLVDEDGHEKRKVRRVTQAAAVAEEAERERRRQDLAAAQEGEVLGMEVPAFYREKQEAEAAAAAVAAAQPVDIFDDVGSDYDPLAGMDSEDSDEDSDEEVTKKKTKKDKDDGRPPDDREEDEASDSEGKASDAGDAKKPAAERNYFGGETLLSQASRARPSLDDPSVLAALRKARTLREAAEAEAQSEIVSKEAEREQRLKKLQAASDRDAEDLDMGFGTNRLQDDEDMEESDVKLSAWSGKGQGKDDAGKDGQARSGKTQRKRGGKKRKGDGNSAADVLRVLEQRKKA